MTDHPISFSAPMVQALLDGRKTQTRRLLTMRNSLFDGGKWPNYLSEDRFLWNEAWADEGPSPAGNPGPYLKLPVRNIMMRNGGDEITTHRIYPRIQPGDRLWVKEAWRVGAWDLNSAQIAVDYCDGPHKEWLPVDDGDMLHRLIDQSREDAKKAGVPLRDSYYEHSWSPGKSPCRWRSPRFMPRWASRMTRDVTEVRVQRLNDIRDADAVAEGIAEVSGDPDFDDGVVSYPAYQDYDGGGCFYGGRGIERASFATLWNRIHGLDAWTQNPWVIALTFTVNNSAAKGGA